MRKITSLLLLIFMVLTFSACHSNTSTDKGPNQITQADLSDLDDAILATTTDNAFVYQFDTDGSYQKAAIWVEKYKKGKRVHDEFGKLTLEIGKNGAIVIATPSTNSNKASSIFNLGIMSDGSTGSGVMEDEKVSKNLGIAASMQANNVKIGEDPVALAGMICSTDDNKSLTVRSDFFNQPDEFKKYDVVYIIKAQFMK